MTSDGILDTDTGEHEGVGNDGGVAAVGIGRGMVNPAGSG